MVSVELDARLLRFWIVEAAAVVTPAIRTDNSIVDGMFVVCDCRKTVSSNRRAPESLSQHTERRRDKPQQDTLMLYGSTTWRNCGENLESAG
jgi:hypothetical protein